MTEISLERENKMQYRKKKSGSTCLINNLEVRVFDYKTGDYFWTKVPGLSIYDDKAFDNRVEKFLKEENDHPYKFTVLKSGYLSGLHDGIEIPYRIITQPHMSGGFLQVMKYCEDAGTYVFKTEFGHFDPACFNGDLNKFMSWAEGEEKK